MLSVSLESVLNSITGGRVYLTKGTTQQIQWLCDRLNLPLTSMYNPTTTEFRRLLAPSLLSERRAYVIYYESLKITGDVNTKSRSKNYGNVKNDSLRAIPSDQFVEIDPDVYIFITLVNPATGIAEKSSGIEGGLFEELDLSNVQLLPEGDQRYPYSWLRKEDYYKRWGRQDLLEHDYELNNDADSLIRALRTPDGAHYWYNLSMGQMYPMFLVELDRRNAEGTAPKILTQGRAWALAPYLQPVISRIRDDLYAYPALLSKFATWVYLSTFAWATPGKEGLWENTRSKSPYWVFKPSTRAKLAFDTMFNEFLA